MAYRTDDVFISHPILGRDFENAEPESARDLGGVFTYSDNFDWLIGHKELSLENALFELKASGETLVETVNNVSRFEILGLQLVALTIEEPELAEKYGYQLTNIAEDWVIEEVTIEINVTYPEGFDVSAEINPNFPEMLGWSKLPDSNKAYIFGLLKIGSVMPLSKVSSDSVHFLGCMALHADTPDFLLKELGSLGIPIIDEVLASRD
jgi:dimeric dUTPase (all-alpha-NTP-PPase superfamily)